MCLSVVVQAPGEYIPTETAPNTYLPRHNIKKSAQQLLKDVFCRFLIITDKSSTSFPQATTFCAIYTNQVSKSDDLDLQGCPHKKI